MQPANVRFAALRGSSWSFCLSLVLLLAACGGGSNDPAENVPVNEAVNAPVNAPPSNEPEEDPIKPKQREATRLYDEAGVLSYKGDNTAALELLEEALEIYPANYLIHERMGYVYMELLRFEESRDAYMKAADLTDGRVRGALRSRAAWCSYRVAHEKFTAGDNPGALTHIDAAIAIDASSFDYHKLRGDVLARQGEHAQAADAFKAASECVTGDKRNEARSWQGQSQFFAGLYRPAIETFTALIDQGVDQYEVYGWRAYCYVQVGMKPEAESDFNQAARRTRDTAKRQEYEEALRELARVD